MKTIKEDIKKKDMKDWQIILSGLIFVLLIGLGSKIDIIASIIGIFMWGLVIYWCLIRPIKLWKPKKENET